MTLKEIAEANCLDYMTVYSGAKRAGVLKRFRKNMDYDEKEVLEGIALYLSEKISKNLQKVARMSVDRQLVMHSLKNKG